MKNTNITLHTTQKKEYVLTVFFQSIADTHFLASLDALLFLLMRGYTLRSPQCSNRIFLLLPMLEASLTVL